MTRHAWIDSLEQRTKAFAVAVIKLSQRLEQTTVPDRVVGQLIDAGTSVGANHRACRQARSTRELASKLSVVLEEADESAFWLELLLDILKAPSDLHDAVRALLDEACELRAIFGKGRGTSRTRIANPPI
jgi:four helix bundle protein